MANDYFPAYAYPQTLRVHIYTHLPCAKSDNLSVMQTTDEVTPLVTPTEPKAPSSLIMFGLIALIALGIFFRFYNIDKKEFWNDEVLTALHVSGGYPELYKEKVFTPAQLQEYQKPHPEKPLSQTLDCLKDFGPEHSPFFYTIAYFWTQAMGSSVAVYRSLPAVLSLAAIAGVYWLAMELCANVTFATFAATVAALSPMGLFFAQETREYSMLLAIVTLLSAAFLRAVRKSEFPAWAEYTVVLVASIYTSLHVAFVLAAQFAYTVIRNGFKYRALIPLVVASIIAVIAFLPWLDVFFANFSVTASSLTWLNQRVPVPELLRIWTSNLATNYVDFGVYDLLGRDGNVASKTMIYLAATIQIVGLLVMGWKVRPKSIYILLLVGLPVVFFMGSDIIAGGIRSEISRYLLPAYVGFLIGGAYLLYFLLSQRNKAIKVVGGLLTAVVLLFEVGSCYAMSQSTTWIGKSLGAQSLVEIANEVNKEPNAPMLISDGSMGANYTQLVGLSRYLRPDVRIQVFKMHGMPQLAFEGQRVYALNISHHFRKWLENNGYKFEPIGGKDYLIVGSLQGTKKGKEPK